MATYVEMGSVLVAFLVLLLLLVFIQNPLAILINSLIAIGILFLLNAIFGLGIPINIITVLIVALGGIIGLLLIILLRLLKVGFIVV
ncbi:pro-sigmaK processing inhibitor BofA family protein [Candidatus Micrarchaeota archaeon]|nr:pro-sigmaK processing inhibitor BofA family protein [Candidatus Micrarchaeota archaeon]